MPKVCISRLSQCAGLMILLIFPGGFSTPAFSTSHLINDHIQPISSAGETELELYPDIYTQEGLDEPSEFAAQRELARFDRFVEAVSDGRADVIRGVYVQGHLASRVIQQPGGSSTYVSNRRGLVTQFRPAAKYGVTGLVAHNYLAGDNFYELRRGMVVHIVYGDGSIKDYQVKDIHQYKKLSPRSLSGDLIDLSTGKRVTTAQVFSRYYRGEDHVTFQTCLERDGSLYWGLLFVVAEPVNF